MTDEPRAALIAGAGAGLGGALARRFADGGWWLSVGPVNDAGWLRTAPIAFADLDEWGLLEPVELRQQQRRLDVGQVGLVPRQFHVPVLVVFVAG